MKEGKYLLKEAEDHSAVAPKEPSYSQIFKEVLLLRNEPIQIESKTYFLLGIMIANIREINMSKKKMDEISLMHAVSHTLFKILTPIDIYYIDDENFLFILHNTNKKKIAARAVLVKKALSKLFKREVKLEWEIIKAAKDIDSLKPFLSGIKMDFFRVRQSSNKCIKRLPGKPSFQSMAKNFFLAYLIFFNIFLIVGAYVYVTGKSLSFRSLEQGVLEIISNVSAGFLNSLNVSMAPFAFLVFIGVTFSVLFGLFGMLLGWMMNVEGRVSDKDKARLIPKKT